MMSRFGRLTNNTTFVKEVAMQINPQRRLLAKETLVIDVFSEEES